MTTISVVIPTYNRRDYLIACLESVAAQRFAPHEVIVVDDGSSDGTVEALAERRDVTLIRQENAGPGAARNAGAAAATGDYIAFLDSDDLWFPWSLEAMAELIEAQDRPSLVFARFEDFSGAAPVAPADERPEGRAHADFLTAAPEGVFAGAGMMVVAREAFLAASGFAEDRLNAEDHDLALRLGTAPGFVQVTQPVIVAHRIHGGNEMGDGGRNLAGVRRLVVAEKTGRYPGGRTRQAVRRGWIATHVRAVLLSGAGGVGDIDARLRLYLETFLWNLSAGRIAFLTGLPVVALGKAMRHLVKPRASL